MDLWTIIHTLRNTALNDPMYADAPQPIRAAQAFRSVLMALPIGLNDGETLVGDIDVAFLTDEARRTLEAQRAELDRMAKSVSDTAAHATAETTAADRLCEQFHCFGAYSPAHTCVNYERVIGEGFAGIVDQIARETHAAERVGQSDKVVYLQAMTIALNAVADFAGRYADLAECRAEAEPSAEKQRTLRAIAQTCRRVPMQPARTFHEALQAIWFVHLSIGISELSDASISLGRLDQYAFALFEHDRNHGVARADLEASLTDLHRKLNRYGDAACTSNLGGVDAAGNDVFNPLSQLILDVAKKLLLPAPILAARVHKHLPKRVFDALIDPKLFAIGQPTFYGESACQNALLRRGVRADRLHRWAANSCMGLLMPGQEISDMWGSVIEMLLPMELTLNAGQPFAKALPIACTVPARTTFDDFDAVYDQLLAYTQMLVDFCIAQNRIATQRTGHEHPNPFLSALTDDCIVRACDRCLGGARYHTVIVEAFGLVNVADALFAIRRLVFQQKRFTLTELTAAAKTDFADAPEILQAILSLPKYGNGEPEPDTLARRLADDFAAAVTRHSNAHTTFAPSFHTLNVHVGSGALYGASLDGRRAGAPVAKNIGTMPGNTRTGHTALMDSATAIDQSAFFGGQALDISFAPDALTSERDRLAIQALLQTYFRLGGLQVQVNSIDSATLRRAIDDPESHRHLIVRIAGYSARFVTLGTSVQHEMADRFERGV